MIKTSHRYNLLSALMAFVLWGGWAFYVNRGHGEVAQLRAAMTQGTASFMITLVMTHAVAAIFSRIREWWFRGIVPAMVTVTVTGSLLVSAHYLADTPELTSTVAPALSVAFLYCLYTAYQLEKKASLQREKERYE